MDFFPCMKSRNYNRDLCGRPAWFNGGTNIMTLAKDLLLYLFTATGDIATGTQKLRLNRK